MNIKKTIISLILLLSILMLCSCEEAKAPETPEILEEKPFTTYQIYWNKTDDVYYLKTDGHADTVSDFFSYWIDEICLSFSSFNVMRESVYLNKLGSMHLRYCYVLFGSYGERGNKIISELKYQPIVPETLIDVRAEMHNDLHYEVDYSSENSEIITWSYYPKALYTAKILEKYTGYFEDKTVVETTTTDDGNSTVYIYRKKDSDMNKKLIRYTLQAEGKTFAVEEIYKKVDDTVPQELHMYSIEGEGYKVEIRNMTERPAKEWLLSFGIEEAPRDVYKNVIVVE